MNLTPHEPQKLCEKLIIKIHNCQLSAIGSNHAGFAFEIYGYNLLSQ